MYLILWRETNYVGVVCSLFFRRMTTGIGGAVLRPSRRASPTPGWWRSSGKSLMRSRKNLLKATRYSIKVNASCVPEKEINVTVIFTKDSQIRLIQLLHWILFYNYCIVEWEDDTIFRINQLGYWKWVILLCKLCISELHHILKILTWET